MRLVAFGILAAMLAAGCALQAGDPGDPAGTSTALTTSDTTPKVHPAVSPQAANSATPPNPEPSPWIPTDPGGPGLNEDSNSANPEPSPWQPDTPSERAAVTGDPQSRGASPTSESAGVLTPNRPGHLGAL